MSDAHQGTIAGGGESCLSRQSQCNRGSEVTLAPHLVQRTMTRERRGKGVLKGCGGDAGGWWGQAFLIKRDTDIWGLAQAQRSVHDHRRAHMNTCYSCSLKQERSSYTCARSVPEGRGQG